MTTTEIPGRITPEQVRAAYLELGWRPKRSVYSETRHGQTCGCGIGVLLHLNYRENPDSITSPIGARLGLESAYVLAFTHGFDGRLTPHTIDHPGYADGRAAWEAVKDLA